MFNEKCYSLCVRHGDVESEYILSSLALARHAFAYELSRHLETGEAFAIDLFSGHLGEYSLFNVTLCLATFTYDGDENYA